MIWPPSSSLFVTNVSWHIYNRRWSHHREATAWGDTWSCKTGFVPQHCFLFPQVVQWTLYWETAPLKSFITGHLWWQVHLHLECRTFYKNVLVLQDRWSVLTVIFQDRFCYDDTVMGWRPTGRPAGTLYADPERRTINPQASIAWTPKCGVRVFFTA